MIPGVINIRGDLRNLQIRQRRNSSHRLVELSSVYKQFATFPEPDQTDDFFKMIVHEIGRVQGRIHATETGPVFMMAIAAVFLVELFSVNIILSEFRRRLFPTTANGHSCD